MQKSIVRYAVTSVAAFLVACAGQPPAVYTPQNILGDPHGSVDPLGDLIQNERAATPSIRVVFVHGIGDTWPGYALWSETDSSSNRVFLSPATMDAIGLEPNEVWDPTWDPTSIGGHLHAIPSKLFRGPDVDVSYINYLTRGFKLTLKGVSGNTVVKVEAIEITWAPLTRWIKTNALGYDAPKVFKSTPPITPPSGTFALGETTNAPPRLWANEFLKELDDRTLADAVLYAGTYGPVMERGVAEALCQAVTGRYDQQTRCLWPSGDDARKDVAPYIFVTHSLGSSIVSDMFQNLTGYPSSTNVNARGNAFKDDEINQAKFAVSNILVNTRAIYMMANQLSFMRLAVLPETALPLIDTTNQDPVEADPVSKRLQEKTWEGMACPRDKLEGKLSARVDITKPSGGIRALGHARDLAETCVRGTIGEAGTLNIIAFSDTNDFLTWAIPTWSANAPTAGTRSSASKYQPNMKVVNVFGQNSVHWGFFEWPPFAHYDYFINPGVWDVMACGAEDGKILTPCKYRTNR
jgi:hypothetical protein